MIEHQIFGSEDSTDYDILCFVDSIPQIHKAHDIIKKFNSDLSEIYTDKELNCNMAVERGGKIIQVFKGTADEVNNSAFLTWVSKGSSKIGSTLRGIGPTYMDKTGRNFIWWILY